MMKIIFILLCCIWRKISCTDNMIWLTEEEIIQYIGNFDDYGKFLYFNITFLMFSHTIIQYYRRTKLWNGENKTT